MKTTKYDPKEFLKCYKPDDCILSIDLLIALHYKAMLGEKINELRSQKYLKIAPEKILEV